MISYLEGKVVWRREKFIILDVHGVGYKVFLSPKTLHKLPQKDKELKVFCYLNVKENALDLYGFLMHEELEFFETLINIRSIGPKAALEIASIAPMEKIKEAIETEDEKIVGELFQVGKKKAQILILELSRKIKEKPKEKSISEDEAFQALLGLGFPRQKIKQALSRISPVIQDPEQKIKEDLKLLAK